MGSFGDTTILAMPREHCGRIDEAIADYRKALEIDSRGAMAHYNLGVALKTRRIDEAIGHYEEAWNRSQYASLTSTLPTPRQARPASTRPSPHLVRPWKSIQTRCWPVTISERCCGARTDRRGHRRISEGRGNRPGLRDGPLQSRGDALNERGRIDEAVADYQQALKIDPEVCGRPTIILGESLASRGQT